jgi:hypothetical protein
MIASRADIEIRFQSGSRVNRGTTWTLHRGRDGDFTSQHDSLLPGNTRNVRAKERKAANRLSQVRHPPLDEKLVNVMIESGMRRANQGFIPFNRKKGRNLKVAEDLKFWREEGRMWVFIRPRGGQNCYLLTCEIRRGLDFCPIHRFDGMDQVPLHCGGISRKMKKRTADITDAVRVEDSMQAQIESLCGTSGIELGKRLHCRTRPGVSPCVGWRLEAEHGSE